jgi:hypothetical protein
VRYFVYYNLHRHLFSAKNAKTGLVDREKYSSSIKMSNCTFKVSEAGRQRVLREQRKNVHAGVLGEIEAIDLDACDLDDLLPNLTQLTYNPYKYHTFVEKSSELPVKSAETVYLINKRIYAKNIKYLVDRPEFI